jgi:nitronate monooxygenase
VAYYTPEGKIDYRCASEPVDAYVRKGGKPEDTEGRRCLCNALLANIAHPMARDGGQVEPPLLTSGDDLTTLATFLEGRTRYSAAEVISYLRTAVSSEVHAAG